MASGGAKVEENLLQAIVDTSDKRQQTRIQAYELIGEILMHNYIPVSLTNHKMALLSALERSLRKGNEKERIFATKLISLVVFQSETVDEVIEIKQVLTPMLISIIKSSKNAICHVRVQCCNALGLLCFIGEEDPDEILMVMRILQAILEESIPDSDVSALYAAVLNSWSLLLTLLKPEILVEQINTGVLLSSRHIIRMVESTHLKVRTASCKTFALVHEKGHQRDPTFIQDELRDLMNILQKLSTTANRLQAKEDRKQQRLTFRDVLHYLQEGLTPEIRIKLDHETLLLDSWSIQQQYGCLRSVLASGMNVHLKENLLVRDILKLGPRVSKMEKRYEKIVKQEQRLSNEVASKNRSIARTKERGKRSYTLE